MPLRSTELLSLGKPTAGSPRRQAEQTLGLALPLKARLDRGQRQRRDRLQ
jgi:hypothetical protein